MRSVTLQKTQKTTLKTSSPIKRTMKPTRDIFTMKQCDAILREFGARPSTAEQIQIFSEAEARSKAKHSKRLVADWVTLISKKTRLLHRGWNQGLYETIFFGREDLISAQNTHRDEGDPAEALSKYAVLLKTAES